MSIKTKLLRVINIEILCNTKRMIKIRALVRNSLNLSLNLSSRVKSIHNSKTKYFRTRQTKGILELILNKRVSMIKISLITKRIAYQAK